MAIINLDLVILYCVNISLHSIFTPQHFGTVGYCEHQHMSVCHAVHLSGHPSTLLVNALSDQCIGGEK